MKMFQYIRYYEIRIKKEGKWKTSWVTNDRNEALKARRQIRLSRECEVTCTRIKIPSYMEQKLVYDDNEPFTFQAYIGQDSVFFRGRANIKYRDPETLVNAVYGLLTDEDEDI